MLSALTIAGSDPSGGAGIQVDIRVFWRMGVHPLSVITSLTVQNTIGVRKIYPVPPQQVKEQLHFILEDIKVDAVKTGILPTTGVIKVIKETLESHNVKDLVIDPVVASTSGYFFQDRETLKALMDELFPLCRVITPNLQEASLLTGLKITDEDDMVRAAEVLQKKGPGIVVLKGGHTEGRDCRDLYYDGKLVRWLSGERVEGEYHGTGCVFSAALTAYMAKGKPVLESASLAKEFVQESIKRAYRPGKGMALLRV